MKTYKTTVKKGNEVDSMYIEAINRELAIKKALEIFYADGWHLVNCEEV